MDDQQLDSAYDTYFRRFADIVGDTVLEQYVGSTDEYSLPKYPIATSPIDFDRGPAGCDRMEAVHILACALGMITFEMQTRIARHPNLMKNRLLDMAKNAEPRPADHTLLGKVLRELTTRTELIEYSHASGDDARQEGSNRPSKTREGESNLPGRSSGERGAAVITFPCDFLVDYRADDKKAAGVIGWAVLMVYQREGDNYRYREFQLTGDVARLILEQYLASQDLTDRLGDQAGHRTKFRYVGNVATNLLKWAELDARFVFDADNSSIVPIKEACLPHPGFQNGMPLHPQFVYLDEWAGWRAFLGCDGSGGIV